MTDCISKKLYQQFEQTGKFKIPEETSVVDTKVLSGSDTFYLFFSDGSELGISLISYKTGFAAGFDSIRVGWSDGSDRNEIMTTKELISRLQEDGQSGIYRMYKEGKVSYVTVWEDPECIGNGMYRTGKPHSLSESEPLHHPCYENCKWEFMNSFGA